MSEASPLLVLGRSGQLARALARQAPAAGFDAVCAGRETLDLSDPCADINDQTGYKGRHRGEKHSICARSMPLRRLRQNQSSIENRIPGGFDF